MNSHHRADVYAYGAEIYDPLNHHVRITLPVSANHHIAALPRHSLRVTIRPHLASPRAHNDRLMPETKRGRKPRATACELDACLLGQGWLNAYPDRVRRSSQKCAGAHVHRVAYVDLGEEMVGPESC